MSTIATKRPQTPPKRTAVTRRMLKGIQTQLRTLIDGEMTVRTLVEIERIAMLSRELLMAIEHPTTLPTRRPQGGVGGIYQSSVGGYSVSTNPTMMPEVSYEEDEGTMAPTSKAETFASSMVRQFVTSLSALQERRDAPDPVKLVAAIVMAREKGHEDMAKRMEAQLFGAPLDSGGSPSALNTLPKAINIDKKSKKKLNGGSNGLALGAGGRS